VARPGTKPPPPDALIMGKVRVCAAQRHTLPMINGVAGQAANYDACDTVLMLKSGTRMAGIAVRVK